MFDCSKDVRAYHDNKVTLPQSERTGMRNRRKSNRDRLNKGLNKDEKALPDEYVGQGSYAMLTMVQDDDFDYDIDDGVYFLKEDLVGDRGGELSSLQAKTMVRDAVDDGSFKTSPEVRANCVRIFYEKGYHVDMPVYRKIGDGDDAYYELAASSGWNRSDARDVTSWYDDARADCGDGPQMRRITRLVKKFAKSRASWKGRTLSGFGITVLVNEKYSRDEREDKVLYDVMKAMRDRLDLSLTVMHPVTRGETITNEPDDGKAKQLREKLSDALDWLDQLFDPECTRNEALGCWDRVFNTTFFSERGEDESRASASYLKESITSAALIGLASSSAEAVNSAGGGRHA